MSIPSVHLCIPLETPPKTTSLEHPQASLYLKISLNHLSVLFVSFLNGNKFAFVFIFLKEATVVFFFSVNVGRFRGMGYFRRSHESIRNSVHASPSKSHPYPCSCGRRYTKKGNLDRHMKFECGKDPSFFCPFPGCDSAFFMKHNLKQHYLSVHNEQPLKF